MNDNYEQITELTPPMIHEFVDKIVVHEADKSTCRNEAIAETFHYMHIVEAWGTGIPRIINRCNEYGLPEPVFEEFGNGFKVILFKKVSNTFEDYIPLLNAIEKVKGFGPEKYRFLDLKD